MNLMGLLKRGDKLDKAFDELQAGMLDVLDEDLFSLADTPVVEEEAGSPPQAGDDAVNDAGPAEAPSAAPRLSSHVQARLAALESFEELHHTTREHIEALGSSLSEIVASHHLTREFLNTVHSDIHRAGEFEVANTALAAENRKLSEQLHDALKKLQERETSLELLQRREAGLLQDRDALRIELSGARLELVEAGNALARHESDHAEMTKALSARTVEAERRLRENEVLREKQVNLTIDLEKALKREAEMRRRFDEAAAAHAAEAARAAEALAALARGEKEIIRLHRQVEAAEARHTEMSEQAMGLEARNDADAKRSQAEIRGLKAEIQSLSSRLDIATQEHAEAAAEVARLRGMLDDVTAERQVAQEMLATLKRDSESDRKSLADLAANLSHLTQQRAAEHNQLDAHRGEAEELRLEIDALKAEVQRLLPYERRYRAEGDAAKETAEEEPAAVAAGEDKPARRKAPAARKA